MQNKPHQNCYWVLPGQLIAGEYPGNADKLIAQERIQQHLEAGIITFIVQRREQPPITR